MTEGAHNAGCHERHCLHFNAEYSGYDVNLFHLSCAPVRASAVFIKDEEGSDPAPVS